MHCKQAGLLLYSWRYNSREEAARALLLNGSLMLKSGAEWLGDSWLIGFFINMLSQLSHLSYRQGVKPFNHRFLSTALVYTNQLQLQGWQLNRAKITALAPCSQLGRWLADWPVSGIIRLFVCTKSVRSSGSNAVSILSILLDYEDRVTRYDATQYPSCDLAHYCLKSFSLQILRHILS